MSAKKEIAGFLAHGLKACLFDLDGVLTKTASTHAAAWKTMFDTFLEERDGPGFRPFTPADYEAYVDGKPRFDGTRSFLESRGIHLPEGSARDSPDRLTIWGLSRRKNDIVLDLIAQGGVETYEGSVRFVQAARAAGLRCAVVSSSANAEAVLESAGIEDLFEVRIDGLTAAQRHLSGKPAPDMFLAGASSLGVRPDQAAVFEDAIAGVQAGHAGSFALVVGVNRTDQAEALRRAGADVVVGDLSELFDMSGPLRASPAEDMVDGLTWGNRAAQREE